MRWLGVIPVVAAFLIISMSGQAFAQIGPLGGGLGPLGGGGLGGLPGIGGLGGLPGIGGGGFGGVPGGGGGGGIPGLGSNSGGGLPQNGGGNQNPPGAAPNNNNAGPNYAPQPLRQRPARTPPPKKYVSPGLLKNR